MYLLEVCVWVFACVRVYGLTIMMLLGYVSRLTKVFFTYATSSPGRVASHSKDPLWFQHTWCLMIVAAGPSHSHWWRSCSLRQNFGQIGSWDGSSRWRFCLIEGWLPGRRGASSASSFLLLICFAPWETFWCW